MARMSSISAKRSTIAAPAKRLAAGFTLTETLLALAILVIMAGIVTMGIPVAFDTYAKSVDTSNAQVLLSTTTTSLRDELGMATDVQTSGGTLYFVSGEGYWASISNDAAPGAGKGLKKHVYKGADADSLTEETSQNLIPDAAITDTLGISCSSIAYADGVFTVKDLKVENAKGQTLASQDEFKIRAIMLEEGR